MGRFEVSTDDAYVKADSTTIAPKVSGYIAAVAVGDNEQVKVGQILARIDDRDFKVAFEQGRRRVRQGQHRHRADGRPVGLLPTSLTFSQWRPWPGFWKRAL